MDIQISAKHEEIYLKTYLLKLTALAVGGVGGMLVISAPLDDQWRCYTGPRVPLAGRVVPESRLREGGLYPVLYPLIILCLKMKRKRGFLCS
jgi:hypothetical protein